MAVVESEETERPIVVIKPTVEPKKVEPKKEVVKKVEPKKEVVKKVEPKKAVVVEVKPKEEPKPEPKKKDRTVLDSIEDKLCYQRNPKELAIRKAQWN